jgi:D-alanyl-D-alanine carboxypeptidase
MRKKRIKRLIKILLVMGTVVSMFFIPWAILKVWLTPLPNTVQEQVDKTVGYGFDGVIVYVQQGDKEPEYYASGLKSREGNVPADPYSLFKIASIYKLYNAVSVTKMVNDGKLSLDKTLAYYMPELKDRIEYADQITLRMLVMHRSGIPNYTSIDNYWAHPKESNAEKLNLVLDLKAKFKPDKRYKYSNTNYLLLGEIMDRVLGYSHFDFIQERILNRLKLRNTFATLDDVNIDDVMSGYYVGYPHDLKTEKQGMLATAEDVGIFLRALNDGSLFDNGEQEIYSSIYRYYHTGLIPGYQSIARYHKDIDAVVIQFTNMLILKDTTGRFRRLLTSE